MTPVPSEAGRNMTLAAPKMPSNLWGKEKLRVSGTVIRCFFASATCTHNVRNFRLYDTVNMRKTGTIQSLHYLDSFPLLLHHSSLLNWFSNAPGRVCPVNI